MSSASNVSGFSENASGNVFARRQAPHQVPEARAQSSADLGGGSYAKVNSRGHATWVFGCCRHAIDANRAIADFHNRFSTGGTAPLYSVAFCHVDRSGSPHIICPDSSSIDQHLANHFDPNTGVGDFCIETAEDIAACGGKVCGTKGC